MSPYYLDILMFVAMVGGILIGFPVVFILTGVGVIFAGVGFLVGDFNPNLLRALSQRIFGVMTNEVLIAIPLFVISWKFPPGRWPGKVPRAWHCSTVWPSSSKRTMPLEVPTHASSLKVTRSNASRGLMRSCPPSTPIGGPSTTALYSPQTPGS